jgi:hypothetical protein
VFWVVLWWLRDGQWDGCADEGEGAALIVGGVGEHGDFGVGGEADLVAGQGESPQVSCRFLLS